MREAGEDPSVDGDDPDNDEGSEPNEEGEDPEEDAAERAAGERASAGTPVNSVQLCRSRARCSSKESGSAPWVEAAAVLGRAALFGGGGGAMEGRSRWVTTSVSKSSTSSPA
jgi:hypothetical protein